MDLYYIPFKKNQIYYNNYNPLKWLALYYNMKDLAKK